MKTHYFAYSVTVHAPEGNKVFDGTIKYDNNADLLLFLENPTHTIMSGVISKVEKRNLPYTFNFISKLAELDETCS